MTISNSHANIIAVGFFFVGLIVMIVMMVIQQKVKAGSAGPPPVPYLYWSCDPSGPSGPTCSRTQSTDPNAIKGFLECQETCGKSYCSWNKKDGYDGNCVTNKPPGTTIGGISPEQCQVVCNSAKNVANAYGICDTEDGFEHCQCSSYENGICQSPGGNCKMMTRSQCVKYCCCDSKGKLLPPAYYETIPDGYSCTKVDATTTTCKKSNSPSSCTPTPPPHPSGMLWYSREGSEGSYTCNFVAGDYPPHGKVDCSGPGAGWCNDPQVVCEGSSNLLYAAAKPTQVSSLITNTDPKHALTPTKEYCFYLVDGAQTKPTGVNWQSDKTQGCPANPAGLKNAWLEYPGSELNGCDTCQDLDTVGNCRLLTYINATTENTFPDPTSCGKAFCGGNSYVPSSTTGGWGHCLPTKDACTCVTDGATDWKRLDCNANQLSVDGTCLDICRGCSGNAISCDQPYQFKCMDNSCTKDSKGNSYGSACVNYGGGYKCVCRVGKNGTGTTCSTDPFVTQCGTGTCSSEGCVGCTLGRQTYTPTACTLPNIAPNLPTNTMTPNCINVPLFGEKARDQFVCEKDGSDCQISDDDVYSDLYAFPPPPTGPTGDIRKWFTCKDDGSPCVPLKKYDKDCADNSALCCRLFPSLKVPASQKEVCVACWQTGKDEFCKYCTASQEEISSA